MIEYDIEDLKQVMKKLITVLSDEQVRALNHMFYSDYSEIAVAIQNGLIARDLPTECEFTLQGDFKY